MRTAKEIRKYLKQQKWYKDYIYNAKRDAKIWGRIYPRDEKNFIRGYKKEGTICGAFFWMDAFIGSSKWSLRDKNFVKWYNKGKKQDD